jgi:hypothetical protein
VCALAFGQDGVSLRGPLSGRISEASPIVVAENIPPAEGSDPTILATKLIEPEEVMPFVEVEDGQYFTLLRYNGAADSPVRLHFSSFQLPEGAKVFVYSLDSNGQPTRIAGPYEAAGPDNGSDFWSGAMPGGPVMVELQVNGEVPPDLPFQIDSVGRIEELMDPETSAPVESVSQKSVFRGMVIDHEIQDGIGVLEGDILLGPAHELEPATSYSSNSSKSDRNSAIAITHSYYRWPNGVIPYVIDSSAPNKAYVRNAIDHWNTMLNGVISLVPRSNQTSYVKFMGGLGCSSYIGRVGGAQPIKLGGSCTTGAIIHEIGHTVGLYHEQSREDRNSWIKVLTSNFSLASLINFSQSIYTSDDLVYYAYNSIMHYPTTAFSLNGKPTLETIPAGIPVGQRNALDIADIAAVRLMYDKPSSAVQLSTVPAGLPLEVDGVSVKTPVTYRWSAGSVHTISAPSDSGSYGFVRWTDGGARSHTVVAKTNLTIAATYRLQYSVTAAAARAGTGTAAVSPMSSDNAYPLGSVVKLHATPASGYCFKSWSGLTASTPSETSLTVKSKYNLKANFLTGAVTPASTSVSVPSSGGKYNFHTVASTGCGWTIKSNASWITVSKTSATSSAPNFSYIVQRNTTGAARTGTITVDRKTVRITQAK